jgi:beta-phosphoglucomutase
MSAVRPSQQGILVPKGCVIFDFDGVIADTESLHLASYNDALAQHAAAISGPLVISKGAYLSHYIVYGDLEAISHILADHSRPHDTHLIATIAATKHDLFQRKLGAFCDPLPGVRDILTWLEERRVPRAICSGARRSEIEMLLDSFQLRHHFDVLVAIEDVTLGKPNPEGYKLAFEQLNLEYDAELDRNLSLVIEDSAGGCAAAHAAGLRVLGVANSLPLEQLQSCATYAVPSLADLDTAQLAQWLGLKA